MLTAHRSLVLSSQSAPELPRIPELEALYRKGLKARYGQVMMLVGRSGSGKSAFALFLAEKWGLPTLYCSADMNSFVASSRVASMKLGATTEEVEAMMAGSEHAQKAVLDTLREVPMTFSYDSPITEWGIQQELNAWVELWGTYPGLLVIDNFMDLEGCEADYVAQMAAMQSLISLGRATGMTILILHHATDKSQEAKSDPWSPPSRSDVKGGLSEKPELSLSVALNPYDQAFRIAIIKQRSGKSDQTGQDWATIQSHPATNSFSVYRPH